MVTGRRLDLSPPDICFLCGAIADYRRILCDQCRQDLPKLSRACRKCGRSIVTGCLCPICIIKPPNFDRLISPFSYEYPVTELIKSLKYNNNIEIARELGIALLNIITHESRPLPEVILPVPLHPLRIMGRGFNQAMEISYEISRGLKLPVDNSLIKRVRHTAPQFNLGPAERLKNLSGAFKLSCGSDYRSVAIVDDIVTTGTTVNVIAGLLKKTGTKFVEVWSCARAR